MAGLVLTAMVILGVAGAATLAPLSSNPRGAVAAAGIAILLALAAAGTLSAIGHLSHAAGTLVAGPVFVGAFLAAWRRIGGSGRASVSDLRPPERIDGLSTGVHLQIHLAAATIIAALLVALDLVAATHPAWRLTDATSLRDLIPPAQIVLAATLALTIGVEAMRVRAGVRIAGRPRPVEQAFALALWRWAFTGWSGLLVGLMIWAKGHRHAVDAANIIVVAVVLLVGVPAVGVLTARLLESWTGGPVLWRLSGSSRGWA